jgi:citrate lyase subunit beta/citryl-CoA lyase
MTGAARPRRSALFMPASNARAIAKARALPCDVVILDLEDAVAPEAKTEARTAAVAAVKEGGFGSRELVVRANALASEWGRADLVALARTRPDAILLPKVSNAADVSAAREIVGDVTFWAMIETPGALLNLPEIASADGLAALVLGPNDLAKELGTRLRPDRQPLQPWLALTVAAARAHGCVALDGVFNAIDDASGLAAECDQGAAFGFDGKTLIHPSQIDAANAAFSPDQVEVEQARAIVAAFANPEATGRGAIRLGGRMVERLHLQQAERTLALADAIARLEGEP